MWCTKEQNAHNAVPHHSFSPAEASGQVRAEETAPEAHWSLPRSEGSGPSLTSRRLPCCQHSAPPLSVGVALPG